MWRWQHADTRSAGTATEAMSFAGIEGWREDDHCAAFACYLRTAELMKAGLPKPDRGSITALRSDRDKARRFFEEAFRPLRVLAETGLLTSYFEPLLKGSRAPSLAFPIPVYRRPADLKPLPSGHALLAAGLTAARDMGRHFEPYFTRADIEAGALAGRGLEILYLADAIEAFIMHVQGSGLVELDDGTETRLTFDGKNGHPYTSVARCLIDRGLLSASAADLDGMVSCLRARADAGAFLQQNKSYIFFKEMDPAEQGPKGSAGVQLHAGRSLAVDPLCHRLGLPIWVSAPELSFEGQPFRRLTVAQDTGSAIKGAQRGDIFAGQGGNARSVAGRVRHLCEFIVLQPKCLS